MVISAAGMAICLLCGGCAGQKAPDAEWNMENETVSEDEGMETTFAETDNSDVEIDGMFTAEPIPDEVFERINGISYVENDHIGREDLRYLRLLYCGFDGETHVGEMITNAQIADEILEIFRTLYENDYPIEKIQLIDE